MSKVPPRALEPIVRCEQGRLSPEVALMELLIATEDSAVSRALLRARCPQSPAAARMLAVLDARADGAARVAAMLRSEMDVPPAHASADEGVAFCRRLFDWSVAQNEEASVALYSLGDASILSRATDEIVRWLTDQELLEPDSRILDLGCGIGRLASALSSRAASVTAVDISPRMLERAARRCSGLVNVTFAEVSGRDLAGFPAAGFELVLAVDVFPYVVQSALSLAAELVAEAARVLAPGGSVVILNFSYRGEHAQDVADVRRFARDANLQVEVAGSMPFALWNGLAFRLGKRG